MDGYWLRGRARSLSLCLRDGTIVCVRNSISTRRQAAAHARWLTPALADTHACIGFLLAETQKGGLRNHPPRRLNCTPLQLIQPPPQGEKINRSVAAAGD